MSLAEEVSVENILINLRIGCQHAAGTLPVHQSHVHLYDRQTNENRRSGGWRG
jgi:hypothetical protein